MVSASGRGDSPADPAQGTGGAYRPGYERAAERILEYISTQELEPGARLPTEARLAAMLGVSRPVARDAIRTLAALGRLTVRRGAGIFVANGSGPTGGATHLFLPVDLDQVYMLFELRRTLEQETSRLAAARATPLELKAIQVSVDHATVAAEANDFRAFRQADDEFHLAVATATHNMFFVSSVRSVIDLRQQVITIALSNSGSGSLRLAAQQHAAVAGAISEGDADGAGAAMCEHVDVTRDQFRASIQHRIFDPPDGAPQATTGDTE